MAINTVGVTQLQTESTWSIYPNPTNQTINLKDIEGGIQSLQIIDLTGKICGEYDTNSSIDITYLTKGTYILRIVRNHRVEQEKFIVN